MNNKKENNREKKRGILILLGLVLVLVIAKKVYNPKTDQADQKTEVEDQGKEKDNKKDEEKDENKDEENNKDAENNKDEKDKKEDVDIAGIVISKEDDKQKEEKDKKDKKDKKDESNSKNNSESNESDINSLEPSDNQNDDEKTPVSVTVEIKNQSSIYGDSIKTLDFTVIKGKASKKELAKDIVLTKERGTEAGSYRITGKCTNPKWNVTFIDATYIIKQRDITVGIKPITVTYGDSIPDVEYYIKKGSVIKNDLLVFSSKIEGNKTVGDHTINGTIRNKNYNATIESAICRILPRHLIVTVDNKVSYKGEELAQLTCKLEDGTLAKGDTLNNILFLSTTANNTEVGEYDIIANILNFNYIITDPNDTVPIGVYKIKNRAGMPEDPTDPDGPDGPTPSDPENPPEEPIDPVDPPVGPVDPPENPDPGGTTE